MKKNRSKILTGSILDDITRGLELMVKIYALDKLSLEGRQKKYDAIRTKYLRSESLNLA